MSALVALALITGMATNTVAERPKVEYIRVEGKNCLQPVVRGTDATLKDYRDAELRWLKAAYPGLPVPEWQTILRLAPTSVTDPPGMQRVHHGAHSVKVVGPHETVEVCFDVNLTTLEPIPRPSPEGDGGGDDPEVYWLSPPTFTPTKMSRDPLCRSTT